MTEGPSPQWGLSNTLAAPRPGWELHFAGTGALGTRAERAGLSAAAMATPGGCGNGDERWVRRGAQKEAPPLE